VFASGKRAEGKERGGMLVAVFENKFTVDVNGYAVVALDIQPFILLRSDLCCQLGGKIIDGHPVGGRFVMQTERYLIPHVRCKRLAFRLDPVIISYTNGRDVIFRGKFLQDRAANGRNE
jgi:hypothetical protein